MQCNFFYEVTYACIKKNATDAVQKTKRKAKEKVAIRQNPIW